MQTFTCKNCQYSAEYKLKKDIEGFPYFKCSNCNKKNYFPLSRTYKRIYILVLVAFVLGFIFVLPLDYILLPGLLVIAAIEALWRNRKLEVTNK